MADWDVTHHHKKHYDLLERELINQLILFLFYYEGDLMLLLSNTIQAGDNPYLKVMVYQKYAAEPQLNKANYFDCEVPF